MRGNFMINMEGVNYNNFWGSPLSCHKEFKNGQEECKIFTVICCLRLSQVFFLSFRSSISWKLLLFSFTYMFWGLVIFVPTENGSTPHPRFLSYVLSLHLLFLHNWENMFSASVKKYLQTNSSTWSKLRKHISYLVWNGLVNIVLRLIGRLFMRG